MQLNEAAWIRDRLGELPDEAVFPLVNVGSSTERYRTEQQPHVDACVFAPLRDRGGRIVHVDMKDGEGVDLVGDLMDPAFVERLRAVEPRLLLVNNVLHHLRDRGPLCRRLVELLPPSGHLLVTGPRVYPRHWDPFDTMFRPDPEALAAEFPGTRLVAGAVVPGSSWRDWDARERGQRSLSRTLVRLLVPIHRPTEWWRLVRQSPYILRRISATAVLLRREGDAA